MNYKRKFLFLITSLTFINIHAQEKLTLSLEGARKYAIEYNKTVKNADMAVTEAQKKINETVSTGLPQLDATVDYSNFLGAKMELDFGGGTPLVRSFIPTSNLNVTLGQLLFSGSYIVGLQTARLYRQLSINNYEKTEQDIREQVSRSYYLALVSAHSLDIIKQNLENTKEIYEKTKAMLSAGMAEKLDIDQLEVQLSFLENSEKSAERQNEMAYNMLRFQLGVSRDMPIELTDSLEYLTGSSDYGVLSAAPFNLNDNLDFQLLNTREQLAEKDIDLKKMNYLPTLSGFYNYTYKLLKPELDFSPKNVIGLNLSIPIFSSGVRNAQLSQARIRYESALNDKSLLSDQLKLQEKQYRFDLITATEQFENRKKNVEVAYRIYRNYQLKFEQGMASSLDLAVSNNNYLQAEAGYIQSMLTLFDARLALQKLLNIL